MKFFNKAKKWLVTTLCASLCLSGALAVSTLSVKATEGGSEETQVSVSSDIQMLVDGLNAGINGHGAYAKAEYVHNFTMSNGAKASGILITQALTDSTATGLYLSDLVYIKGVTFDVSSFTGDKAMFSYIIAPVTGDDYCTEMDTTNKSGAEFSIGIFNTDNNNGWVIRNAENEDARGSDKEGNPCNGVFLYTYNTAGNAKENRGCYYDDEYGYLVGLRGYAPISFRGYQTTPFSVYYDYATNVVYKDKIPNHWHATATHRLLGFPNVQPSEFGTLASTFDNKYCGKDGFTLDAYTGNMTFKNNVAGFENGKARVGLRIGTYRGTKFSVLLTNVMGLDLTNPNSTFADGVAVLSADDTGASLNKEYRRYEK